MKTVVENIFSVAITIVGVACAWYGVHGNQKAFNLYRFLTILSFTSDLMIFLCLKYVRESGNKDLLLELKRPVWKDLLARITDTSVALIMAAFGHWVFAIMQILQLLMESVIHDDSPEEKKRKADAEALEALVRQQKDAMAEAIRREAAQESETTRRPRGDLA